MRVFNLANESDCLGEISLILLRKEYDRKNLEHKKVKTLSGISARWFAKIVVRKFKHTSKGYAVDWERNVLADWVTGTLYNLDGTCLSSTQLAIVETDEKPHCFVRKMLDKFEYGKGSEYEIGAD